MLWSPSQQNLPAFLTVIKDCLTFISRTQLHGVIFHFMMATRGTFFLDLASKHMLAYVRQCHSTALTIALACLFSLLCWTKWRLDFRADWKERSDEVVMTSVASTPAVLNAQLHWLHNKISSSPPAISKRLPHSGQKVSEPMILAGDSVAMLCDEKSWSWQLKASGNVQYRKTDKKYYSGLLNIRQSICIDASFIT